MFVCEDGETVGGCLATVSAAQPASLAVRANGVSHDFAAFDGISNAIAAIAAAETRAEDRVILYMDQGALLLAAIMGVLKAGRVYVPVDPAYPAARNGLIAASADASLILTDTANAPGAELLGGGLCLVMNLDLQPLDPATRAASYPVSATSPACLIYTSGSTGQPKGVVHTHRSILKEAFRRQQVLNLSPSDRCTLLYSCSSMGALMGTFTALLHGASLFPSSFQAMSIGSMVTWLREERITVYHSVPTVFRAVCAGFTEGMVFPDMRLAIFGGEPILRSDIERVFQWFPSGCQAVCSMGMSEAGTLCAWILDRDTPFNGERAPCGYALAGTALNVVRDDGSPAEPDEVGELHVTGRYLFSGYWRNEAATAAVLSRDPGDAQSFVYRTGDLVSIDAGGVVSFHARLDSQLSIRGFRVEAGEVESALMLHPSVASAAIGVLRFQPEAPVLAAFVVARGGVLDTAALRRHLAALLPLHMVPTHYRVLDALPATPVGKLDRRALQGMEAFPIAPDAEVRAPQTALEQALHGLFLRHLPGAAIGVSTDFFDAGGTSLAAIQLLSEIEVRQGKRVPLAAFFASPTVSGVLASLGSEAAPCAAAVVPLRESGSRPPLFFMLGGDIYRPLVRRLDPAIPAYTVMLEWESDILLGGNGQGAPSQSATLDDLARIQAEALIAFQPEGPFHLAGLSFGGKLAFQVAKNLRARGREVAYLALFDPSLLYPSRRFGAAWALHQSQSICRLGLWSSLQRIHRSVWPRLRRALAPLRARSSAESGAKPDLLMLERARLGVYYRLSRHHTWIPYEGKAVLFRARDSVHALVRGEDPTQGWGALVKGGLTIEDVPGDHTGILEEPNVAVLAEIMNAQLRALDARVDTSRCAI